MGKKKKNVQQPIVNQASTNPFEQFLNQNFSGYQEEELEALQKLSIELTNKNIFISQGKFLQIYRATKIKVNDFYKFTMDEKIAWIRLQSGQLRLKDQLLKIEANISNQHDIFSPIKKPEKFLLKTAELCSLFIKKNKDENRCFLEFYIKMLNKEPAKTIRGIVYYRFTDADLFECQFSEKESQLLKALNKNTKEAKEFFLTGNQIAYLKECFEHYLYVLEEKMANHFEQVLDKRLLLLLLPGITDNNYGGALEAKPSEKVKLHFQSFEEMWLFKCVRFVTYVEEIKQSDKKIWPTLKQKYFSDLVYERKLTQTEQYLCELLKSKLELTVDTLSMFTVDTVKEKLNSLLPEEKNLVRIQTAIIFRYMTDFKNIINFSSVALSEVENILAKIISHGWDTIYAIDKNNYLYTYEAAENDRVKLITNIVELYNIQTEEVDETKIEEEYKKILSPILHQYLLPTALLQNLVRNYLFAFEQTEKEQEINNDNYFDSIVALQHYHPKENYRIRLEILINDAKLSLNALAPKHRSILIQLLMLEYYIEAGQLLDFNASLTNNDQQLNIHQVSTENLNALQIAIIKRAPDSIIKKLLDAGANFEQKTRLNLNALDVSLLVGNISAFLMMAEKSTQETIESSLNYLEEDFVFKTLQKKGWEISKELSKSCGISYSKYAANSSYSCLISPEGKRFTILYDGRHQVFAAHRSNFFYGNDDRSFHYLFIENALVMNNDKDKDYCLSQINALDAEKLTQATLVYQHHLRQLKVLATTFNQPFLMLVTEYQQFQSLIKSNIGTVIQYQGYSICLSKKNGYYNIEVSDANGNICFKGNHLYFSSCLYVFMAINFVKFYPESSVETYLKKLNIKEDMQGQPVEVNAEVNLSEQDQLAIHDIFERLTEKSDKFYVTLENISFIYKEVKNIVTNIRDYSNEELDTWILVQLKRFELPVLWHQAEDSIAEEAFPADLNKLIIPENFPLTEKQIKILFSKLENGMRPFVSFYINTHSYIPLVQKDKNLLAMISVEEFEMASFTEEQKNILFSMGKKIKDQADQEILQVPSKYITYLFNLYEIFHFTIIERYSNLVIKSGFDERTYFGLIQYLKLQGQKDITMFQKHPSLINEFKLFWQYLLFNFARFLTYKYLSSNDKNKTNYSELFFPYAFSENFKNNRAYYAICVTNEAAVNIRTNILLSLERIINANSNTMRIELAYYGQNAGLLEKASIRKLEYFELNAAKELLANTNWNFVYLNHTTTVLSAREVAAAYLNEKEYLEFLRNLIRNYLLPLNLLKELLKTYPEILKPQEGQVETIDLIFITQCFSKLESSVKEFEERINLLLKRANSSLSERIPFVNSILIALLMSELFDHAQRLLEINSKLVDPSMKLDLNAKNSNGESILYVAIYRFAPYFLIKQLIKNNVPIDKSDFELAWKLGRFDIFLILMKDPNVSIVEIVNPKNVEENAITFLLSKGVHVNRSIGAKFSYIRRTQTYDSILPYPEKKLISANRRQLIGENEEFLPDYQDIVKVITQLLNEEEQEFLIKQTNFLDNELLTEYLHSMTELGKYIYQYVQKFVVNNRNTEETYEQQFSAELQYFLMSYVTFKNILDGNLELDKKLIKISNTCIMYDYFSILVTREKGKYLLSWTHATEKDYFERFLKSSAQYVLNPKLCSNILCIKDKNSISALTNDKSLDYSDVLQLAAAVIQYDREYQLVKEQQKKQEKTMKSSIPALVAMSKKDKKEDAEKKNENDNVVQQEASEEFAPTL